MSPSRWDEIERLYHAALERSASERVAFLADACAGDAELQHDVESLLAHASATSGFLDGQAVEAAAQLMTDEHPTLVGRQVGAYRVASLLGAGGMGEVYRARDTKLGRDVALKVLPPLFTADRDRLARFEREARLLATLTTRTSAPSTALKRPMVSARWSSSSSKGHARRSPCPGSDSIEGSADDRSADCRRAGCRAREGYRSSRPEPANIKITPDGTVKVLDFGLAKLAGGDSATDRSQSPTLTSDGTRVAHFSGRLPYMSPEQARGKAVDKRTDIWAFGCVLYEMLTGKPPFSGETISDTIAAILEREPDWKGLPTATPANVRRVLERCFDKDPKRRLRDIGDVITELEEAPSAPVPVRSSGAARWMPATAIIAAIAVVASLVVWSRRAAPVETARPVARFTLGMPAGEHLFPQTFVAISPEERMWH